MSNYKVLFCLRFLKSIVASFVDVFLVLYFLDVSNNNILPLGIYKLVAVISIYAVIFFTRNIARTKKRINLLRIGIILDFIYFSTIIFLKDKVIDYIYLVGLLYGLEEGFYYSVLNTLESDGVTNDERTRFNGEYATINSILSIIFPIAFGSLITFSGFLNSLIIVFLIIVVRIMLSFLYKDIKVPKRDKTDVKKYLKITKNNKKIKQMSKVIFFSGITYSEGAFSYIVTIYIIKIFSDSFSLGICTSIFSVITAIIGILFAKRIKTEDYTKIIKISIILTILSLLVMIIKCNAFTIITFNLFQTISRNIMDLINNTSQMNIANEDTIKKEYKVEYGIVNETYLVVARVLSYSLFILMSFTNSDIFIVIFAVLLVLFAYHSIKLQDLLKENN